MTLSYWDRQVDAYIRGRFGTEEEQERHEQLIGQGFDQAKEPEEPDDD